MMLCCAILAGSCNLVAGPQIDCGPLAPWDCDRHVGEIQAMVIAEFPGRRVASIEVANDEGDAMVRLDDGTEIGWGGSDGPRRGD
jgi:hypothetical protein